MKIYFILSSFILSVWRKLLCNLAPYCSKHVVPNDMFFSPVFTLSPACFKTVPPHIHPSLYIVLLMCNVARLYVNVVCVLVALREEVSSVGVCCVISDCSGYVNPIPHRSGEGRGWEEEERGRHCYTQSAQTDGRRGTGEGCSISHSFFPPPLSSVPSFPRDPRLSPVRLQVNL